MKEQQKYEEWSSQQPPVVEPPAYTQPTEILRWDYHVGNDRTNASDGGATIPIECNEDETT